MNEMRKRLSVREMFSLAGIDVDCDAPFPSHVASDSRDIREGGAFVALEGERTDGHHYIGQAIERGAALIVARKGKVPNPLSVPCVELAEPEADLGELASRYIEYAKPDEIVAVTGSVGKTTTREAIRRVLEGHFPLHAAERSFNTVIGCSATALAMPLGTKILLMEFGANSVGEIGRLTRLFPPTRALVTQVSAVHLAGFGSLEGVLREKMKITESPRLKTFIYDGDGSLLRNALSTLPTNVQALGVGREKGQYLMKEPMFDMKSGLPALCFELERDDEVFRFQAGVWGEKLALPVAMAAVVGEVLGLSPEKCAAELSSFSGLKGRGRVVHISQGSSSCERFVVDDAYNANPVSMRSSLETFLSLKMEGEKWAVLGDMRELGDGEVQYHKELTPLVEGLDRVVFVGHDWKEALQGIENVKWNFVDRWQGAAEILEQSSRWKALLVKGSNSLCLEDLVARVTAVDHSQSLKGR